MTRFAGWGESWGQAWSRTPVFAARIAQSPWGSSWGESWGSSWGGGAQSTRVYGGRRNGSDEQLWLEHAEFMDALLLENGEDQDLEVVEVIAVLAAVGAIA